jgi:hypothetical protein
MSKEIGATASPNEIAKVNKRGRKRKADTNLVAQPNKKQCKYPVIVINEVLEIPDESTE